MQSKFHNAAYALNVAAATASLATFDRWRAGRRRVGQFGAIRL
jgi:hypothetical protein